MNIRRKHKGYIVSVLPIVLSCFYSRGAGQILIKFYIIIKPLEPMQNFYTTSQNQR